MTYIMVSARPRVLNRLGYEVIPEVVIKAPQIPKFSGYKRILIATDFSAPSDHAASLALPLLSKGGRLLLFHVVHPVMVPVVAGPDSAVQVYDQTITRHAMKAAEKHLSALGRSVKGVSLRTALSESFDAADEVARQAKRFKAELVLLSTHGRSGLSRLLFGSVAQRFLAHYQGAVLLLRPGSKGRRRS